MTRNIAESESDNLNPYQWQYIISTTNLISPKFFSANDPVGA